MKATANEFRFRFLIFCIIYVIAFIAPWDYALHFDSIRTWQLLAATVARNGWLGFSAATIAFLVAGIVLAFAAAGLRTWASAYMGTPIVHAGALHGEQMVAAGPYRYVRNPLYIGTFLHTLALALLMPPSGAVFCIIGVAFFELRLIGAEEAFLTGKLGEPYIAYCAKVPRLLPALTPQFPASEMRPAWLPSFAGEIYLWGAALAFAVGGWRYNSQAILQGVIISLGVSLIVRALLPKR